MDEPTHDSQIQQWFQGLGPSPVQPASPALQAKVRARILDQQRRSGSWTNRLSQPAWVTALIAALILSLSANIWWGIGERMRAEPKLAGTVRSLTVYPFQRQLSPTEALRVAVAARTAAVPENIGRSFATTSDRRAAFLRLGTMYADALAALHSRDSSLASTYLQRLADILHGLQVPPVLSSYLQDIAAWMQRPSYTDVERIQLLALFEALYITVYTPLDAPHAVSLFQMGAWLENMVLAVTIRQPVMPQHPEVLQTYYGHAHPFPSSCQRPQSFSSTSHPDGPSGAESRRVPTNPPSRPNPTTFAGCHVQLSTTNKTTFEQKGNR